MAAKSTQRPANRPSRRDDIVAAAAQLLATDAPELISVADIARHAGLTSAAIYYHFRSRDELVDEIVATFAAEWSGVVAQGLTDLVALDGVPAFIDAVFDWIEADASRAMVYFVSSIGVTLASETVRRETRYATSREVGSTLQRLGDEASTVDLTVRSLGLVTLLEVGAADALRPAPAYRTLGRAKFRKALSGMVVKLFA